jgi:hypothetical protein
MTWTDTPTPLDPGSCFGGCWADDLAEFVGAGQDDALTEALIRSADGINWIYEASPFDGGKGNGVVRDVPLGLTVAVGQSPDYADAIVTSPDDMAWSGAGNPFLGVGAGRNVAIRASDDAILAAGRTTPVELLQFALSTDDTATWARDRRRSPCLRRPDPDGG